MEKQGTEQGRVSFHRTGDILVVGLAGPWHLAKDVPSADLLADEIASNLRPKRLAFDTTHLTRWDSGLITFLVEANEICRQHGIDDDPSGLPNGLRRLLELAEAVPEKKGARSEAPKVPFFARVGNASLNYSSSIGDFLSFLGDVTLAFGRLLRGRARFRSIDLLEAIEQCGASAVGIVALIAFLVGVILAFMGAVQLSQFGASIYVADLVGIGMVREMGAMMTAIIMSGRTGAAFAAKLGTMKVTQEIDALQPKIVQGSSIAQAFQFVDTRNAELGFVALAQLYGNKEGTQWLVPQKLYSPIRQDAVLLKTGADNAVAKAFLAFLRTPEAHAVIERFGYTLE